MDDNRKRNMVLQREMTIWELNINELKRWLVDLNKEGAVWTLAQRKPKPRKRDWVMLLVSIVPDIESYSMREVSPAGEDIPGG